MIAYKERFDFSYLHFPHSPFELAVFEESKGIVARPIIDLDHPPYSPFFTYKGKIYKTEQFETNNDSIMPQSLSDWLTERVEQLPFSIDMAMPKDEKELFNTMLKRKKIRLKIQIEELNEWLSKK